MQTFKKLLDLLNSSERKRAGLLVIMILIMALFDTLGIASILPFIAILANPQLIDSDPLLNYVFQISASLGIQTTREFLFLLGFLVFAILVFSLTIKAFTSYLQTRFTLFCEYSFGERLVKTYLHQPYSWFLNRHSADLGKTVLSEVSTVIFSGMMPLMTLVAQAAVIFSIITLLMLIDSSLTFIALIVFGIAYGCIYITVSNWLKRLGEASVAANKNRFTALSEAFGAAKEVKLGAFESIYIQRFAAPAKDYARVRTSVQIIAQLPRYLIEIIAFGGLLLIIFFLMGQGDNFANALPTITLFAFAGYRLMPALQQLYQSFTQLRFVGPALDVLHADIVNLTKYEDANHAKSGFFLTQSITLSDIVYRYPNMSQPALKNINLIIPYRGIVGFVGATGSGKTTTADIILGLLEPQEGQLLVDHHLISARNRRDWQSIIGYVPQQIYLTDDTIAANIAFGVNPESINQQLIEHVAKIANLHNFVMRDLRQGYSTLVGERGVRLSGGERQRIGIARALYHNPQVLILDEATSALDNVTELAVMEAVQNLSNKITIILIAHRLSTVKQCDQIYLFEGGKVTASGTYNELLTKNTYFAALAKKDEIYQLTK